MPKANKEAVRELLKLSDGHYRVIADEVGIKPGVVRNFLNGIDAMRPARVHKVTLWFSHRLNRPYQAVWDEIVAGTPDPPPDQPTQPVGPQPRRDGTQKPAPRRERSNTDNRRPRKSAAVAS